MTKAPTTSSAVPLACWSCSAVLKSPLYCPECRRIQPLPPSTDYFAAFDLPRKLVIDVAELERRFHTLSWKLHPDNFMRASEYERQLSLDQSSHLNDAYRTLREPIARVEYLLALEGMRKEGEKKQQAPPDLLEEVFELNESLDDLRVARRAGGNDGEMASLRRRLESAQRAFEEKLAAVDAELEGVFTQWDAAVDSNEPDDARKKIMARMNDILNRRSYIRNLVTNVRGELAEA